MQSTLRILFVDDEETFLRSTTELLRRADYLCDCTTDVSQALEWLGQNKYDLAIVDINMPGNVDLEFVQQLAEQDSALPVILVTAYPSIDSAIHSVELPVIAYLVKPFEIGELLAKIQSALPRIDALGALREEISRLQDYGTSLARAETLVRDCVSSGQPAAMHALAGIVMRNVVDSLAGLQKVARYMPPAESDVESYRRQLGPTEDMRTVLRDAVATLERTKGAFRSKELGALRRKLEQLLES